MPIKKTSASTVWYNSLAKPRSNLHQESREKQNYVYALPPIKNLHQEPFFIIYFFSHSPTCLETTMPTVRHAYIYAMEASFFQVAKNRRVFCQTVGGVFLMIFPK
jgi:hypothetical protein